MKIEHENWNLYSDKFGSKYMFYKINDFSQGILRSSLKGKQANAFIINSLGKFGLNKF